MGTEELLDGGGRNSSDSPRGMGTGSLCVWRQGQPFCFCPVPGLVAPRPLGHISSSARPGSCPLTAEFTNTSRA